MDIPVYAPFIVEVEMRGVIVRRVPPEQAVEMVEAVLASVNIVKEHTIHDKASEIALLTGCRAIDAYYIATAKQLDAALITSDKIMRNNALKARVNAYYLPDNKDYEILLKLARS